MRIVVGDDAEPLRILFGHIARELGHEVVAEAADADALLRMTRAHDPDAVVIDGRLPPDGALPVISSLRKAAPEAAIFVVAALGETAFVRDAVAAGAAGAIVRPYLIERVAASFGAARP